MQQKPIPVKSAAVIGGGPAGLMAAEVLIGAGLTVHVYDAMPSVGRKFLIAGKGGMNITHSEPLPQFLTRYGKRQAALAPCVNQFSPEKLRAWLAELGIQSFTGSSGRVFPEQMKAAPLLRSWLHRLRERGVKFFMRHEWCNWQALDQGYLLEFNTPEGIKTQQTDAVILALGGGSWAKLGSTGAWVSLLQHQGVSVAPLLPSNCGFDVAWSEYFSEHFAGQPVKTVVMSFTDSQGDRHSKRGEFNITSTGVEGSLIYALSSVLRDETRSSGHADLLIDLLPDVPLNRLIERLEQPRGKSSLTNHLRKKAGLTRVKASLLRECLAPGLFDDMAHLAHAIKHMPLRVMAARPLDEAISSAGGVVFEALTDDLMIKAWPGIFCAGEMLDWEAPTGGYLLTACLATGRAAGQGAINWLGLPGESEMKG
ncbi:MAG: TIGR03862 family flavoprotein [Methylomicrobium sp.]|nr:TIGR03862 family flavoprotein [Methylomicrobium sp.]